MGSVVSMHIFLEEHLHPALHKTSGSVCNTLRAGWTYMLGSAMFALASVLCYAADFSSNEGNLTKAWSPHVLEKLRSTYIYYTSSIAIAAVSVATVSQIPAVLAFVSDYSVTTVASSIIVDMVTLDIVQTISYSGGLGAKQVAFVIHSAIIGIFFAPVCVLGNTVMVQAAWMTAATVGVVSLLALFVPPYWTRSFVVTFVVSILVGHFVSFVASVIGVFWATSTEVGAHSYALNLYVGLVAVAGSIIAHIAGLVHEVNPQEQEDKNDPISTSIWILGHTLSMFMRIAILLVGGGDCV